MPNSSEERQSSTSRSYARKSFDGGKTRFSRSGEKSRPRGDFAPKDGRRSSSGDDFKKRDSFRKPSESKGNRFEKRDRSYDSQDNRSSRDSSETGFKRSGGYKKNTGDAPFRGENRRSSFGERTGEGRPYRHSGAESRNGRDRGEYAPKRRDSYKNNRAENEVADKNEEKITRKSHIWNKETAEKNETRKRGIRVFDMGHLTLDKVKDGMTDVVPSQNHSQPVDNEINPQALLNIEAPSDDVVQASPDVLTSLFEKARTVRNNAYAPYSKFAVGAAILAKNGAVYGGCNVENVSYPCGTCAETGAIAAMIADGQKQIQHIVIVADSKHLIAPCGACLQRILEFVASDALVHLADLEGIKKSYHIAELLPVAFSSKE